MGCSETKSKAPSMWTQPRGRPHFLSLALWPPASHLVQNGLEETHWTVMWRLLNTLPTQLPWERLWGRVLLY